MWSVNNNKKQLYSGYKECCLSEIVVVYLGVQNAEMRKSCFRYLVRVLALSFHTQSACRLVSLAESILYNNCTHLSFMLFIVFILDLIVFN